jgi:hypothetical protein
MSVPGFAEPLAIRLRSNIDSQLREIAEIEGFESPQKLVRYWIVERMAQWQFDQEKAAYIKRVLNGNGNGKR